MATAFLRNNRHQEQEGRGSEEKRLGIGFPFLVAGYGTGNPAQWQIDCLRARLSEHLLPGCQITRLSDCQHTRTHR